MGTTAYDQWGARPDATFSSMDRTCISTYGDSFTYGEEVDNRAAWAHFLSQDLSCRVANYGVSGYGIDQAYLRFKNNAHDEAPTVILGIYQEGILRIVNQYRFFLNGNDLLGFKPRFIMNDGQLQLIPIPIDSSSDLTHVFANPGKIFMHEWFLPGSNDGQAYIRFPYTTSIIHALLMKRVQNGLLGKPDWLEFYSPDHPSGAFLLMRKIIASFSDEAKRRGKQFKVMIFPSTVGYQYWDEQNINPTQTLSDALTDMKVDYLDLTPAIHSYLGGKDYCGLLTNEKGRCSGHYNEEGNRVVSSLVKKWLTDKNGYLEKQTTPRH